MDSLFAKIIIFFASIFSIMAGPSYIKLGTDSLIFDFKTGENYPIYYYLNTQNIGPKKARFEISPDVSWISVYREGSDFAFVELPPQAYINFVLGIRPERLPDGVNQAKVFIKVLDIDSLVSQEVVLDKAEVPITLNKNIILTPTVEPTLSPVITPVLTQTFSPAPIPISNPQPTQSPQSAADLNPILKQIQLLIDSIQALLKRFF